MLSIDKVSLGESVDSIVKKGWKSVGCELRKLVESEGWESLDDYSARKIREEGWSKANSLYYRNCEYSGAQSNAVIENGIVIEICGCCLSKNNLHLYRTGDPWTVPFSKLGVEPREPRSSTFSHREQSLNLEIIFRDELVLESFLRRA